MRRSAIQEEDWPNLPPNRPVTTPLPQEEGQDQSKVSSCHSPQLETSENGGRSQSALQQKVQGQKGEPETTGIPEAEIAPGSTRVEEVRVQETPQLAKETWRAVRPKTLQHSSAMRRPTIQKTNPTNPPPNLQAGTIVSQEAG
uniref:Zinc finger protein 185 with LIM domain n=1 Tax=Macrostomum lignano TaxID=282301 RepID=A0A1I8F542_9PLAT